LKVVLAGGGTGGHLYPAIAIADALRARGADIVFVGTADRLEATIVPKAGYKLLTIASRPWPRREWWNVVAALFANVVGALQSLILLWRLRPDAMIATGGYVCFPAVLAARVLRKLRNAPATIALLEPNAKPGLTNRLLAPFVDEVWGAFDDADPHFAGKYVRTGVPVRSALRELPPRAAAAAALGLDAERKTILAMGGSQGARTLNDALVALVNGGDLPPDWQLLAITGVRDYARIHGALQHPNAVVVAYLDDPSKGYASADLVIARAGASTLAELSATAKPAILVPYPYATDDHQTTNALRFAAGGAAVVVADDDVRRGGLRRVIAETLEPHRLAALRSAAVRPHTRDPLATILDRVERLTARKKTAC
jgi:UDP-N-acetylglucosamine--N-acetylmuramyl-(pentapeptide) pyrophosphoryl-undecaprenol N-acetylglucosamine transferase